MGSLYRTWFLFGFDFIDYPLSLRGNRRADKLIFTRRHRAHTLGLGASVFILGFLPIVNSVLLTTAVIGAVMVNGDWNRSSSPGKPVTASLPRAISTAL